MSAVTIALLFALVGLLFVGLSIPLIQKRVPPNRFYGFRTPKTLSDPKIWYEINHISGVDLLLAGAFITISSLTMLVFAHNWTQERITATLLIVMVLSLTGVAVRSYCVLRRMETSPQPTVLSRTGPKIPFDLGPS